MKRRYFLQTLAGSALASPVAVASDHADRPIRLALKIKMANFGTPPLETFRTLARIGFDGVELNSPGGLDRTEALAASRKASLPIHGVVNSIHWKVRLSDPSDEIREKSLQGLLTAIRDSHALGGSSVLLVPGVVDKTTSQEQAWSRSVSEIRKALPLAAELGVHILIENVWNRMFYSEKGGSSQTADQLVAYLDELNSPWVGSYFDIGNHQRFSKPADWIRKLGRRIVKLDVKDWGVNNGFCKIGEGDVDWPAVRTALDEIGFTGWATAEVKGGNRERCGEILGNMRTHLLGA